MIIALDEQPVTGIDATTQELLMDLLEAQAARGKTVVATTHDLACAAQRWALRRNMPSVTANSRSLMSR